MNMDVFEKTEKLKAWISFKTIFPLL